MKRIFLIGYMGAGKTTIGKELAKHIGLSFIDLDMRIEGRYHKSIKQIFQEDGEVCFREIERRMLREVSQVENVIISTGGGLPCFGDNMAYMNRMGTTVYLRASVAELVKRLEVSKSTRPVLAEKKGEELTAFVKENLFKREPFYNQAAIVFDAEVMLVVKDVKTIVEDLSQTLNK